LNFHSCFLIFTPVIFIKFVKELNMKTLNLLAALLLFFILGTGLVFAQSDRGTLRGTVTDPSDAVVPNAKVVLTGVDNGESRETTTGDEGIYVFPEIKAGLYKLTVEAPGFRAPPLTTSSRRAGNKINCRQAAAWRDYG
jgi:hypothetical protein